MNKVTVIGGGAAGLMAAIAAAESGAQVCLIEPNERLGKKVNITGKGRCNVTNDTDLEGLMAHIPRNGRFLYSALSRFTSRDTMAFFEGCGVPLKVERGDRVFPVSDSAFDITDALKRRVKALHIRWAHDRATAVETAEGHVTAVTGEKETYPSDAVIVATGGVSYPGTAEVTPQMSDTAHGLVLLLTVGKVEVMQRFIIDTVEVDDVLFAGGVFFLELRKSTATTVPKEKAVALQRNPALNRKLKRFTGQNAAVVIDHDAP